MFLCLVPHERHYVGLLLTNQCVRWNAYFNYDTLVIKMNLHVCVNRMDEMHDVRFCFATKYMPVLAAIMSGNNSIDKIMAGQK